ncbi:GNAT family N-acetyltransferase [Agromyces seonyuensis]|uniref:GNAT family N-acetyltransferase n=1 Tax=Agromyces seonyuensis TaxID=2662446 RepID=UPI0030151400
MPFDAAPLAAEPLETPRLRIRPLASADGDDVWEYQRLADVLRFIPWPERDRAEAQEHTDRRAASTVLAAAGDGIHFACELVGEPALRAGGGDRVVGDVMLRLDSVESARVEIGWVFHPGFQGRGLASEGAGAVLDLAFERLRAHRVHAILDRRNDDSARLCARLGMRLEATHLADDWFKGEWTDTEVWAVLREERTAFVAR